MGWKPEYRRIKERYNAVPNARERAFHLWLMDAYPCVCGCGYAAGEVHHPLDRHPLQRWRRDHEFVVPMFWQCHRAVHRAGSDQFAEKAWQYRAYGLDAGYLREAA